MMLPEQASLDIQPHYALMDIISMPSEHLPEKESFVEKYQSLSNGSPENLGDPR